MVDDRREPTTVWAIESSYAPYDLDNRREVTSTIDVDEGWFSTEEEAKKRVEQLNESIARMHAEDERRAEALHQAKIDAALQTNREAAAIRAAGMSKDDVAIPKPYRPRTLEQFLRSRSYTAYEAVAVERSEHDSLGPHPEEQA